MYARFTSIQPVAHLCTIYTAVLSATLSPSIVPVPPAGISNPSHSQLLQAARGPTPPGKETLLSVDTAWGAPAPSPLPPTPMLPYCCFRVAIGPKQTACRARTPASSCSTGLAGCFRKPPPPPPPRPGSLPGRPQNPGQIFLLAFACSLTSCSAGSGHPPTHTPPPPTTPQLRFSSTFYVLGA